MRITAIVFILIGFGIFRLHAQGDINRQMKDISYYSDIVANAALISTKATANENLIKQLAMVPPTTISNPGTLRKTVISPPVTMAASTRTVPPTSPMIVAMSIFNSTGPFSSSEFGYLSIFMRYK